VDEKSKKRAKFLVGWGSDNFLIFFNIILFIVLQACFQYHFVNRPWLSSGHRRLGLLTWLAQGFAQA
jgi:hypothetical protein